MNIDFFGTPEKRVKYGKADHLIKFYETSRISKITPELVDEFLHAHSKLDLNLVEKFSQLDQNTIEKFPQIEENFQVIEKLLDPKVLETIRKLDWNLLAKFLEPRESNENIEVIFAKLYDHFWKNVADTPQFKEKFQKIVDVAVGSLKETARFAKTLSIKIGKHFNLYTDPTS
jgi:hypothetical protein